jgi:multiple sugar transport system permease protein
VSGPGRIGAAPGAASAVPPPSRSWDLRQVKWAALFLAPWVLGFAVFLAYPVAASLFYSFTEYSVLAKPVWIGLGNYADLADDEVFWISLWNTLRFAAMALPLGLLASLGLAAVLHVAAVGRSLFRAIFFLPSLVPLVANAIIWLWMFNGEYGLLNAGLRVLGVEGRNWLSEATWAMPAFVLMSLWGVGHSIVIFLAAFQEVPTEMYEAAELDGATAWQKFTRVTMPLISPVIFFQVITGVIGVLQVFVYPYIMTGGGPQRSTLFYALYLYQNAFQFLRMGYACAMAWILFLLILGLTFVAVKVSARYVHYQGA